MNSSNIRASDWVDHIRVEENKQVRIKVDVSWAGQDIQISLYYYCVSSSESMI
jgi:hypothetical protein